MMQYKIIYNFVIKRLILHTMRTTSKHGVEFKYSYAMFLRTLIIKRFYVVINICSEAQVRSDCFVNGYVHIEH